MTSCNCFHNQEVDDDEVTNSMASRGPQQQGERAGPGVAMPTSRWNVDGDELPRADLDVRYTTEMM